MNVKIFYGGLSGFRKILPANANYMPIVDLAILDDARHRKVKVDVQGNRIEEEEDIPHYDNVVAFSDDYPSLSEGTIESFTKFVLRYDIDNLSDATITNNYKGPVTYDHYGRKVPKHAHGTINLSHYTSSTKIIMKAVEELFDSIINWNLSVRRINVTAARVVREDELSEMDNFEQFDLFTDYAAVEREREQERKELEKEKKMQQAVLDIQKKFGKNAMLKGMNFEDGAMTRERNRQIGGHKA